MPAPSRSGPTGAESAIPAEAGRRRLVSVHLDAASIGRGNPDQEHERRVAIFDLVDGSSFALPGHPGGPYQLRIALRDARLALDVLGEDGGLLVTHILSMAPLRSILRDYRLICESYYAAIRTATPAQIEAIDMGRRGLHDEAAELLSRRLEGKVEADFPTLRRLFTLVAALHWKG